MNNEIALEERVLDGSLFPNFWHIWECPTCGKRLQSVSQPVSMWWNEDHRCSFLKVDRFGNLIDSMIKSNEELFEDLNNSLENILNHFKKRLDKKE